MQERCLADEVHPVSGLGVAPMSGRLDASAGKYWSKYPILQRTPILFAILFILSNGRLFAMLFFSNSRRD